MNSIIDTELLTNQTFNVVLLCLAVFRIYLEVIGFKFTELPIAKRMGQEQSQKFHKMGFYFSLGYFVLFAPTYLI
jgi:hypothetical protein